jgi:regulatory protein
VAAALDAFETALRQLSRRARTVLEVRRHLRDRGFSAKEVAGTVERLSRLGYLDDRAYAVRYAGWAAEERPMGRRRVAAELMRRGVARDTIERALDETLGPEQEAAALERALAKAARGVLSPPDERTRRRVASALLRRGFRPAQVMVAVQAWASGGAECGTEDFEE